MLYKHTSISSRDPSQFPFTFLEFLGPFYLQPKCLKEHVDEQRQQAEDIAPCGSQQHRHGGGLPLGRQDAAGHKSGAGGATQGLAR